MVRHLAAAGFFAYPASLSLVSTVAARIPKCRDAVIAWLLDRPSPGNADQVARRIIDRWGNVALDVALARSAAETAGFFDDVDTGSWSHVSQQIGRSVADRRIDTPDTVEVRG